ncbi:unnamed protein product [Scytosiphon promiscuus]
MLEFVLVHQSRPIRFFRRFVSPSSPLDSPFLSFPLLSRVAPFVPFVRSTVDVDNMNAFIDEDPSLAGLSLTKLMEQTEGTIFNNVAQIYNHNIYWESLSPNGGGMPTGGLYTAIIAAFGTYEDFQDAFSTLASGHFGSGWAWLVLYDDGSVGVVDSHDAANPVTEDIGYPLLVCDVWEHAYYLDYQNLRSDYIDGWWALVNWEYAASEYASACNNSSGDDK